jgi:hypothetical protein
VGVSAQVCVNRSSQSDAHHFEHRLEHAAVGLEPRNQRVPLEQVDTGFACACASTASRRQLLQRRRQTSTMRMSRMGGVAPTTPADDRSHRCHHALHLAPSGIPGLQKKPWCAPRAPASFSQCYRPGTIIEDIRCQTRTLNDPVLDHRFNAPQRLPGPVNLSRYTAPILADIGPIPLS